MRLVIFALIIFSAPAIAENVKVASWNIEHLGTGGRGFGGGFGGGNLPARTSSQLVEIGDFISNELKADLVALQEIAITGVENGVSLSEQLDVITESMGSDWVYVLPPRSIDHGNESMYVGYLWNSSKVRLIQSSLLPVPKLDLAGKALFDREPFIGYFELVDSQGESKNDFALVNVHLASGQDNDENHLIAMTIIEFRLNKTFDGMGITESDRIVLGDFNDNPYSKSSTGKPNRTPALYTHMEFKGYTDFVTEGFHSTRMDSNLKSVIDHILVNKSALRHIDNMDKANIWMPPNGSQDFAEWRQTFSDHFPISVDIKISADDDAD